MASKLAAAKIAAWSGVETTIAQSNRPKVLRESVEGVAGVGTVFRPRAQRLPARKLWIAFALPPEGRIVVDEGARKALQHDQRSLLPAGVIGAEGTFAADDAVELVDGDGAVFAKGLTRWSRADLDVHSGRQSRDLPEELGEEVVHRDDLVILP
jgi:glutamate 5-kinase